MATLPAETVRTAIGIHAVPALEGAEEEAILAVAIRICTATVLLLEGRVAYASKYLAGDHDPCRRSP